MCHTIQNYLIEMAAALLPRPSHRGPPSQHAMGIRGTINLPPVIEICPRCGTGVAQHDDFMRCANRCQKWHRQCWYDWAGKPCFCNKLLCDFHPDVNFGASPGLPMNPTCLACGGPSYPTQPQINTRWAHVFKSRRFQNWVRRYHPHRFPNRFPGNGPSGFNMDHVIVTHNLGNQRDPVGKYYRRRAVGDNHVQAMFATYYWYKAKRLAPLPSDPSIHSYLGRSTYLRALISFFANPLYSAPIAPNTRDYDYDRLVYWHRQPNRSIVVGAANVNHRCNFSPINAMIHTHPRDNKMWNVFRRMMERDPLEWNTCG